MNKHFHPLEWVDDLQFGDYSLDNHTKEFLRLANRFIDANNIGNGEDYIDTTLNALTEYSHKHFPSQEDLMNNIHYPSIDEHIAEHRSFNLSVAKLLKRRLLLKRTDIPEDERDDLDIEAVLADAANFIVDWYHRHLLGTDKRLSDYYNYEYKEK